MAPSPSKAMGSPITHPSPLTHHPQGWFSSQAPSTATSPYPCNRGRTRPDHRRSNRPQHTQQHPCHNWSHHEHQPQIPQRLAQGTTTQTSARRLRRVRDLRTTSRQITAHTTPVERRSRRDHPGVTRRRPTRMGQRATDTPALQPAQKQPQRRVCASAAHTHTTTESDKPAIEHEHMVSTSNAPTTTARRPHPTGGYPAGPIAGTSGKAPISPRYVSK